MTEPVITNIAAGTGQSNVDATSYTTGSFTVTSGRPVLFVVATGRTSGTAGNPTLTALPSGVTAAEITNVAANTRRLTIFRLTGAGTGTITIDYAGVTQHGCQWQADQGDTNMTSTLPTNFVAASSLASGTSISVALSSATNGNSLYAAFTVSVQTTHTPEGGWTQTTTRQSQASPSQTTSAQTRASITDLSAGLTLGTQGDWLALIVEIPAVVSSPPISGTLHSVGTGATMSATGTVTQPTISGTINTTEQDAVMAATGTVTTPPVTSVAGYGIVI